MDRTDIRRSYVKTRTNEIEKVEKNPKKIEEQARIVRDDSNMRCGYANVSNVAGGREEIVLLLGMNQAWHATQREVKVQLTDRIVLSPLAAKRLSILLGNVIKDYEQRYGVLEIGHQRPDGTSIQ